MFRKGESWFKCLSSVTLPVVSNKSNQIMKLFRWGTEGGGDCTLVDLMVLPC